MKKIFVPFLFVCTLLLAPVVSFASVPAGIQGKIWFSKDPFYTGDTLTIFALIYNSSDRQLSGMITLADGTTTINKKPFAVDASGGSSVVSFPYFVKEGSHSFTATLSEVMLAGSDGAATAIDPSLTTLKTVPEKRIAHPEKKAVGSTATAATGTSASLGIPAVIDATKQLATTSANVVGQVSDRIAESAPVAIATRAVPVIGAVEEYRVSQAKVSGKRVAAVEEKITPTMLGGTSTTGVHSDWGYFASSVSNGTLFKSPFQYVELFFMLLWNFFTTHVMVFYTAILLVLYKIVRMVLGVFF